MSAASGSGLSFKDMLDEKVTLSFFAIFFPPYNPVLPSKSDL